MARLAVWNLEEIIDLLQGVEQDKGNAKHAHDTFVNTISKKTGIPVAESAHNGNGGDPNQE